MLIKLHSMIDMEMKEKLDVIFLLFFQALDWSFHVQV